MSDRTLGQLNNRGSTVGTTWPATRPTDSFFQLGTYSLNMQPSGFRFPDGNNPADPFIPCQLRDILPCCSRFWVGNESFP